MPALLTISIIILWLMKVRFLRRCYVGTSVVAALYLLLAALSTWLFRDGLSYKTYGVDALFSFFESFGPHLLFIMIAYAVACLLYWKRKKENGKRVSPKCYRPR
jgi:hypothetical protein